MEMRDILKIKGIKGGSRDKTDLRRVESESSRVLGRNTEKPGLRNLKTFYESPEINQILQQPTIKDTERLLKNDTLLGSPFKPSGSLPPPTKIHRITAKINTGGEYIKQKRFLRMPVIPLRTQIESMERNLRGRIEKEKQIKEEDSTFAQNSQIIPTSSRVKNSAFHTNMETEREGKKYRKKKKQLLDEIARNMQTPEIKYRSILLQHASENSSSCPACKFKEQTIIELEALVYSKNKEIQWLEEKLQVGKRTKLQEGDPTCKILSYQQTIANLEKCLNERDTKIKQVESVLKTLQLYNGFTKQQSYFVEYAREMEKLEQENSRLRSQLSLYQRNSALSTTALDNKLLKKAGTKKIINIKEEKRNVPLIKESEESKKTYINSFIEAMENFASDFDKLKELFAFKDLIREFVSVNVQNISLSLFKKFEIKEEEADPEESNSFSSSREHSGKSVDEEYCNSTIPKTFKKILKLICEGMKELSEKISKLQGH